MGTVVAAMVFCRRCRAKASRSLQSDAARVEQGEVAEGSIAKDVVTIGVPFDNSLQSDAARVEQGEVAEGSAAKDVVTVRVPYDNNVVTGIPVGHESVSDSTQVEARRVSI